MYYINPSAYSGVTVMPSDIALKYLKLTGEAELKAAVFIFSDPAGEITAEKVAEGTGLTVSAAADALLYWLDTGVIRESKDVEIQPAASAEEALSAAPKEEIKPQPRPRVKPGKISYGTITRRLSESEEVRRLFYEAQLSLGRTIGTNDQSVLLSLFDYYGLPVEVILTICAYAKTAGKQGNISYINKIGEDWGRREIDTVEKANAELMLIESAEPGWAELAKLTGLKSSKPSTEQKKYFAIWNNEWHFPVGMIALAANELDSFTGTKGNLVYMNSVLGRWKNSGIFTPEQVEQDKQAHIIENEKKAAERSKKKTPKQTGEAAVRSDTSYDIDEAQQQARNTVPVLRKKSR